MVKVKVVGAGGYGGSGLLEILVRHKDAQVTGVIDIADVGKPIGGLLPHLAEFYNLTIQSPDDPANLHDADVIFFATPDGAGMAGAREYVKAGIKVIDFSGDFRFNTEQAYGDYAKTIGREPQHKSSDLLPLSMYGLSELHRKELKKARLVGNPGCFAVSCILGMAPAVKYGLVTGESIICDCKTGVSGAGKKPSPTFHYPARYDTMNAYKLTGHQHVFEIERELSLLAGSPVSIFFTPQVVPMCRGILSTLYAKLSPGTTKNKVWDAYRAFYDAEPFVRLFSPDQSVSTGLVRGTNCCYLTIKVDEAASQMLVISHIDNLMKGQAGSAIQNMNILFGLDETMGLNFPGMYP